MPIACQVPRPTRLRQQRYGQSNLLHLRAIDQQIPTLRLSTDTQPAQKKIVYMVTAAHRILMHSWTNTAIGRILKQ